MKKLQVLFLLLLFIDSYAQNDYQKYTKLSFAEIDSLMYIEYNNGAFEKAITLMEAGREKAREQFGERDSLFGLYTGNLGFFYEQLGVYSEAEKFYLQAKDIYTEVFNEEHTEYANMLNNLAGIYRMTGSLKKAEPFQLKALDIWIKKLGLEHLDIALSYNNLGLLYSDMGYYEKAEVFFLKSKSIYDKKLKENDPSMAVCLNNLADLYQLMGNYEKAEPLLLKAKDILAKTVGEEHSDFALCIVNLAGLYENMSNYEKAELLYLQAQSIYSKTIGEQNSRFANMLNNLAILYKSMGELKKAEKFYLKAIEINTKVLGAQNSKLVPSYNNLAVLYNQMKEYKQAEQLYTEAKIIYSKSLGEKHPSYANVINNLAGLYMNTKDYPKAEQFYLQTKNIYAEILNKQHPLYANTLNSLSALYCEMGRLDTALQYCQEAIRALFVEENSNFQDWGNLDKMRYSSNLYVNNAINELLTILYAQYLKTKDKNKLDLYYQITQSSIRLNERIRNEFGSEGDKLRSLETTNRFMLLGLRSGLLLKKTPAELFNLAESNKSVLLMDAAKTSNAYKFGDLPDSLVAQERLLQKTQSQLQAKLLEKLSELEKDSLLSVLNKTKQEIDDFTKNLKKQYPKYVALKYENKIAQATDIQKLLDDKTALLEYVIGDSVIYILYLDKNKTEIASKHLKAKELGDRIKDFHANLSNYSFIMKNQAVAYEQYTENAYWFYENLVAPVFKTDASAKQIQRLIIVTDGELGHLPFETFLVKPAPQKQVDYNQLDYLMNHYSISYSYSATLWKAQTDKKTKHTNNGQILAMAANYDIKLDSTKKDWRLPTHQRLRDGLGALPAAKKEVETLAEIFDGFFGFDYDASEKKFKEKAADYAVIHLAMHGLLNAKSPILSSLAFTENSDSLENNFLQAYEISKMKLNADLVVLSACETGYGKFEKGNGIASLAQAFAYAGVPSMIVSLWQVSDYATSEIMKNFYQNLADGMEKDIALREAKIQYMKNAEEILAHPAFWSPFIQMGNTDAIVIKTKFGTSKIMWIGGGLLVLAIAGFGFLRRKKNN